MQIGDKAYIVDQNDSEIECYIYKIHENFVEVKFRESSSFGFYPPERITLIDPPNWETLEENLKKTNATREF